MQGNVTASIRFGEWRLVQPAVPEDAIQSEQSCAFVLIVGNDAEALDLDAVGMASVQRRVSHVDRSNAGSADLFDLARDVGRIDTRVLLENQAVERDRHPDRLMSKRRHVAAIEYRRQSREADVAQDSCMFLYERLCFVQVVRM